MASDENASSTIRSYRPEDAGKVSRASPGMMDASGAQADMNLKKCGSPAIRTTSGSISNKSHRSEVLRGQAMLPQPNPITAPPPNPPSPPLSHLMPSPLGPPSHK